jgi:hypothetical protein
MSDMPDVLNNTVKFIIRRPAALRNTTLGGGTRHAIVSGALSLSLSLSLSLPLSFLLCRPALDLQGTIRAVSPFSLSHMHRRARRPQHQQGCFPILSVNMNGRSQPMIDCPSTLPYGHWARDAAKLMTTLAWTNTAGCTFCPADSDSQI